MGTSISNETMEVFLDLDPGISEATDLKAGEIVLSKFEPILQNIGKRAKSIKKVGISYNTASVSLFDQAKDLYALGYFVSSILVCRSAAEHIAYELFCEEINISGDQKLIQTIAESIDFRKIVSEFLYNKKKGVAIIDESTCKLFHELYDLGNQWIHPKSSFAKMNSENQAEQAITMLQKLIESLRNVLIEYDINNGKLQLKPDRKQKIRPVVNSNASAVIL